jgi:[ribosomal protein S18]-alanine N-acetyltransferase
MLIRPATRADIPGMLLLTENTPTASRWIRAQYERLYDTNAPRRVALICEEGSALQALIVALVIADEWEIENVVVAPEVRRRGLATRLLKDLIDQARAEGARAIFLEVREGNGAAHHLYKSAGFHETGRRPRYYSDPVEDAILYRHSLA